MVNEKEAIKRLIKNMELSLAANKSLADSLAGDKRQQKNRELLLEACRINAGSIERLKEMLKPKEPAPKRPRISRTVKELFSQIRYN